MPCLTTSIAYNTRYGQELACEFGFVPTDTRGQTKLHHWTKLSDLQLSSTRLHFNVTTAMPHAIDLVARLVQLALFEVGTAWPQVLKNPLRFVTLCTDGGGHVHVCITSTHVIGGDGWLPPRPFQVGPT
jgi:hypothetical protein